MGGESMEGDEYIPTSLRERNLRDPLMHADALFSIEEGVKGMALATERLVDQVDELEAGQKQRYEDLCSYLLSGPQNTAPEIVRSLRHIKMLLVVILILFVVNLFR
jgi:hypothetical protein